MPWPLLQEFPANGSSSGDTKSFSSWGDPTKGRVLQAQLVDTLRRIFHHLSCATALWVMQEPGSGFSLVSAPHRHPAQAAVASQPQGHWSCHWRGHRESREGQLSPRAQLSTPEDEELSPGLSQHCREAGAGNGVMDLQHMEGNQELPIPQGSRIVPLLDVQRLDLVTQFSGENLLFCSSQVPFQPKGSKYCSASATSKPIFAAQGG